MTRNATRRETHTIQCWPGGRSWEYRGDLYGPENQRSLREGHYQARLRCQNSCAWTWIEDGALYMIGSAAPITSVFTNVMEDPRAGRHCVRDPLNYPERVSVCPVCKGEGLINNPKRNPWRKGTAEEWREIRVSERAERIWAENGRGCDSALVDDLIKAGAGERGDLAEAFSYDQIRNLYADPSECGAAECREYAEENGIDLPEVPLVDCELCAASGRGDIGTRETDPCPTCKGKGEVPEDGYEEDDSPRGWLTEARDACRDHAQDNPTEVYEWWRVTSWLCAQLHEIGEVTIDNEYGQWWGRTCTGQQLIMDGTLQRVAARMEVE